MPRVEEELVVAPSVPRHRVPMVTQFRSTWLTSSVRALQNRGLLDRYAKFLSAGDRDLIFHCAPASWVPASLVVTHYEARDKLQLSTDSLLEIGADVTARFHGPVLQVGRSVATASGVTPWTLLGKFDRLWPRISDGGAVVVAKLGPKEARIELLGFPVAPIRYNRIATRGILKGMVGVFCTSTWVHEVAEGCTRTTLAYRVQWS